MRVLQLAAKSDTGGVAQIAAKAKRRRIGPMCEHLGKQCDCWKLTDDKCET